MAEADEPFEEPAEDPVAPEEPAEAPGAPVEGDDGEEEAQDADEAQALSFDQLDEGDQAKVLDKLDREAERHRKRLTEIIAEDALSLLPCELCNPRTAGW